MPTPAGSSHRRRRSPGRDDGVVLRTEQQRVDAVEVRVQPLRQLVVARASARGSRRREPANGRRARPWRTRPPRTGNRGSSGAPAARGRDRPRTRARTCRATWGSPSRRRPDRRDGPSRPRAARRRSRAAARGARSPGSSRDRRGCRRRARAGTRPRGRRRPAARASAPTRRVRGRSRCRARRRRARASSSRNSPRPKPMSSTGLAARRSAPRDRGSGSVMSSAAPRKCALNASALVPGVEARAGNARRRPRTARTSDLLQLRLLLGELELQIVELLDHARVVRVGEHVRGAAPSARSCARRGATGPASARARPGSGGRRPWRSRGAASSRPGSRLSVLIASRRYSKCSSSSSACSSSASRNDGVGGRSPVTTRRSARRDRLRARAGTRRRAGAARRGRAASRAGARDQAGSGRARTSAARRPRRRM